MIPLRHIAVLVILSCLFTGIIFIVNTLFFAPHVDEEIHLEPTLPEDFSQIIPPKDIPLEDDLELASPRKPNSEILAEYRKKAKEKKEQEKFFFSYIPQVFEIEAINYESESRDVLSTKSFQEKIEVLNVEMYKTLIDVRGKMKNKTIKMFGVLDLSPSEYMSVFIHEFAHYLDIYFFSRKSFGDTSQKFYDISWESTSVMKPGQERSGFVSGYSMTNKYEDFAESFTYYVLHNNDFLEKSQKSTILRDKYEFFGKYLFFQGEFITTDFSEGNVIRSYYWDITKLPVNVDNFLQYIKNTI